MIERHNGLDGIDVITNGLNYQRPLSHRRQEMVQRQVLGDFVLPAKPDHRRRGD